MADLKTARFHWTVTGMYTKLILTLAAAEMLLLQNITVINGNHTEFHVMM